jgi:hypothetical protein
LLPDVLASTPRWQSETATNPWSEHDRFLLARNDVSSEKLALLEHQVVASVKLRMDLERVLKALDSDVVASPRRNHLQLMYDRANNLSATTTGRGRGRVIYGYFIFGLWECREDAITASSAPHSSMLLTTQSSQHRDLHKGKGIFAF